MRSTLGRAYPSGSAAGNPVAHSRITSHVDDNRPCIVELLEMIQCCRLDGDTVKGWDLDVAHRSANQPPPLGFAGRLLFLVVLSVDRNPTPSVEGQRETRGKKNGGIKKTDSCIAIAGSGDVFPAPLVVLLGC